MVNLNNWHHVVLTYDVNLEKLEKPAKIYVDGELKDSDQNFDKSPNPNTDANMFIGQDSSERYAYYFHGNLDDIQIYNKVLSEDEIKALANIK